MTVEQLRPGLWRWTARHPEWSPDDDGAAGWPPEVASVFYEAPDGAVLIDPLVPDRERERFWGALDRDVERAGGVDVLLSVEWHERSALEIARRYGVQVWVQARALEAMLARIPGELLHAYELGEPLPVSVEARDLDGRREVAFWLPGPGALVIGDLLVGSPGEGLRLCPESWLEGSDPGEVRSRAQALLELPVELVLPAHGDAVAAGAHEALERALR